MNKPTCTPAQLKVLKAASNGHVSRPDSDHGPWRLITVPENARDRRRLGRAVTQTVETLIDHGLARKSTEVIDGRLALVVIADGYELLSQAAHDVQ